MLSDETFIFNTQSLQFQTVSQTKLTKQQNKLKLVPKCFLDFSGTLSLLSSYLWLLYFWSDPMMLLKSKKSGIKSKNSKNKPKSRERSRKKQIESWPAWISLVMLLMKVLSKRKIPKHQHKRRKVSKARKKNDESVENISISRFYHLLFWKVSNKKFLYKENYGVKYILEQFW